MSNLKPLKWHDASGVDGVYSERTDSYIKDALWFCSTLVAEYVIRKKDDKYVVSYGGRTEPEYETLDEAKKWCEHTHYRDKMQPYVKPMPTWIDVNEREPTEKGDYLIRDYQGRVAMGKYDKGFYMESGGEKWGCVQCWMPIPEFSKQGE